MLEDFVRALHEQLGAGKLGGTALVAGLKSIAALVPPEPPPPPVDEGRFSVLDRLESLPPSHALKLLKREVRRLSIDLAAHEAALESMKEK